MLLKELRTSVLEANLELVKRGLVLYTFGNVSGIDRDQGLIVIKPSGVDYDELIPEFMVVTDLHGKIIDGKNIVITQPESGSFKAFSAICTHEGCIVNNVSNGTINCPCHGSKFSIKDGSVVNGPAPSPLASIAIKVEGTSIFQG